MPDAVVIVVGGGASGLSAAAALTRRRIEVVVLEQDATVGGTWARRYDRLRLHSVRAFSGLAHFSIPRRFPAYLSRNDVVAYLDEYARHFNLRVITGTTVDRIRPRRDPQPGWIIDTAGGDRWHCRVVVVATGQYRDPILPAWPGREAYTGMLTHSTAYKNAAPYVGKRVLVVGAGNSGAEIATDLGDNGAKSVDLSVRTPPPIVPRDPFGMPVQRTSLLLSTLPVSIANRFARLTAKLTIGDLTRYGMPAPAEFSPYTTKRVPLIDVGFVDALKRGQITIRPAVECLTPTGAIFADGTNQAYDAIIAATGFSTGLDSLIAAPDRAQPGVYFIGYFQSLRGHWFEANRASRRLAREVERYLTR